MAHEFYLTEDHIKLLRRAAVRWQDYETGAPEINPKRPYGNGRVEADVCEILGWDPDGLEYGERVYSDRQIERASAIHHDTLDALRVFLGVAKIEPGRYTTDADNYQPWFGWRSGKEEEAKPEPQAEPEIAGPQRWEYAVRSGGVDRDELNSIGNGGWELVSVDFDSDGDPYTAVLKRPKR